ncbi:MAG TPA: PIN domain-containing protein [Bryobacteraceae bacterium]|nr:PIN domain-containing protein [Bryobacteraceae bacterium]
MAAYFADTSFWIALSRQRDQYHRRAVAWNQVLIQSKSTIVTTEAVLWEWLNALSDASTRGIAAGGYRRARADGRITIVPFQRELIDSAVELYRARSDKSWSLTDCLSFVVMERHDISEALATDRHFEQAGRKPMLLEEPAAG